MKKIFFTLGITLFGFSIILAQEGKPSVKIFSNFNYEISDENDNFKQFEIKRSYLGYSYKYDDKFSAKIIFDVGSNEAGSNYTAFLKIASLSWNATENLSINLGQVGTKNFKFMENAWGKRYVEKSAMDKYKWASAADAGITATYSLSKKVILEGQILNGEGYKKYQDNSGIFRTGFGGSYNFNNNLSVRVFKDIFADTSENSQDITTAAIAYSNKKISFGAEKNIMENSENIEERSKDITSIYGSFNFNDKITLFGRIDNITSPDEWNIMQDGSYTIIGIERQMNSGVKVSLNMQSWTSSDEENTEETLFVNFEYKF